MLIGAALFGAALAPETAPALPPTYRCAAAGPATAYQTGPASPWLLDIGLSGTCSRLISTKVLNVSVGMAGLSMTPVSLEGGLASVVLTDPSTGDETSLRQAWNFLGPTYATGEVAGRPVPAPLGPYAITIYDTFSCPSRDCDPSSEIGGAGVAVTNVPKWVDGIKTWWVVTRFVLNDTPIAKPT